MVYESIDYGNDVTSHAVPVVLFLVFRKKKKHVVVKKKKNCSLTTRLRLVVPLEFWTFYDVISMVYTSVNHGKLWLSLLLSMPVQLTSIVLMKLVVGSLPLSERFFSEYSGFPLSSKTNNSKFQFDQESSRRWTTLWMCYPQIILCLIYYLLIYYFNLVSGIWLWRI